MKQKKYLFMTLILLASTALFACSGGKKERNEVSTSTKGTMSTQSSPEGERVYGGSIIVGITQDLDSLDPHKAVAAGTREVLFNIYEGLVKPNVDGNLVPAVASDYKILDEGRTYTFTLKNGVKFHNGTLVTVDDVVYSIKRCAGLLDTVDASIKQISALSVIKEVTALDDKTVQITLKEANTELLGYLTMAIVPMNYSELDQTPVGTGPFKFVSYEPLGSMVIAKNEEYYVDGIPYLDKVTFKISANTDTAFMELMAGSIDVFPYLTNNQAQQLTNLYHIEVGNSNLVQALFLNHAVKPLDNVLVRKALCYGINRNQILDMVAGGKGTLIGSNMFPNFKTYFNEEITNTYSYDVKKAKELLAQAGYPNGFTFTITLPSNYQFHIDCAQVMVEQLKAIGVTANIQLVEWASWLSDVYAGRNFEATVIGLDADLAPSSVLLRYNSDSPKNFVNYSNKKFDELYHKASSTTQDTQKVVAYKELQKILSDDAAAVYLQDPAKLVAVNKNLTGYQFYPVYVQDMASISYVGEAQVHE